MLRGIARALLTTLLIMFISVSIYFPLVSSSTGTIRINSKTASASNQQVQAGGNVNLYFGEVTWSGSQLYLLMSSNTTPQVSAGDMIYTPLISVSDITDSTVHAYSSGMGAWIVGNNWINGSIAPNIAVGQYTIKAFDLGTSVAVTDVYIIINSPITASLQVSPPSGPGGVDVTLTGSGYPPSSSVTISYYDSAFSSWNFLGTTTADGSGSISFTSEVPDLRRALGMGDCPETYAQVSYRTEINGIVYGYADYNQYLRGLKRVGNQIASELYGNGTNLSSTIMVKSGDTLTISGKWFHPGVIYVRWDSTPVVGTVTSNEWQTAEIIGTSAANQATGSFETTVTIPTASAGQHYIAIEDSESRVVIKVSNYMGTVMLSPPSGPGGVEVTITGSDYPPSSSVNIAYHDPTFDTWNVLGTTTANSEGNIAFTSEVPDLRRALWAGDFSESTNQLEYRSEVNGIVYAYANYGQYPRGLKRVGNQIASGLYGNGTNFASTVIVESGDTLTISGKWFHPGVIYVRWDGIAIVGTVTSNEWLDAEIIGTSAANQATGSFETTVTIPTADEGEHYISVEDSETKLIISVHMQSNSTMPPTPPPLGHALTVESVPTSEIVFTVDGDAKVTPYTEQLEQGSYIVEMPENQVVNGVRYIFQTWIDGPQERTRTVNLVSNVTLRAVFYAEPVAEFTYNPQTPRVGEEITFDASTSSDADGFTLTYHWNMGDGTTFTTADPVVTHTYDSQGKYTIELTVEDETELTSTVSEDVTVKIPSDISVSTSSSSTVVGFQVKINGTLVDGYGNSLVDKTVVIKYAFEGTSTWTPITSDQTDSNGRYSAVWIPPATGYFTIKAEWTGNSTHLGSENSATINSITFEGEYVFSVESNSTITDLSFNSTDRTLRFNAQGATGTKGYAKVIVAKSLVTDLESMRVYLDGNQIEYSVQSTDDSWCLIINYNHSTHRIVVNLDVTTIPEFPYWTQIIILLTTIVIVSATYRKKLRKHHSK